MRLRNKIRSACTHPDVDGPSLVASAAPAGPAGPRDVTNTELWSMPFHCSFD